MASSAICLDQNENTISCTDPSCTYGDCGATGVAQVTSGSLCLDSDQNAVACSDPECTYGDCTSTIAGSIGHASVSTENYGGSSLTSPNTSGANSAGSTAALVSGAASLASTITTAVTGPPKTTLTLGASGLTASSMGGLFSNPLMLGLLAVIAFLLFGMFRKRA